MSKIKVKGIQQIVDGGTTQPLMIGGILSDGSDAKITINSDGSVDTYSLIPSGAIQLFAMNSAPIGWLKANGQAVSRITFSKLFAAIGTMYGAGNGSTTFNVPDLRGEFVRGFDDGKGVDGGRVFGSSQLDSFQKHQHEVFRDRSGAYSDRVNIPYGKTDGYQEDGSIQTRANTYVTDGGGTPRVSSETRPRNIALLYCIKV